MKYDKYEWFYGVLSYVDAEAVLKKGNMDGCFLVRISSSTKYYVLSLLHQNQKRSEINHYKILQATNGRFHLQGQQHDQFCSLAALVEAHYRTSGTLSCRLKCSVKKSHSGVLPATKSNRRKCNCTKVWEIDLDELEIVSKLGVGSFGIVYEAKLRKSCTVAVKTMINGMMSEEDFIKEAQIMTELKHPNIVRLCGVCVHERPLCIVTEFMKHGNLWSYLRKYRDPLSSSSKTLRNICAQVSYGMAYLEERQFVHRDLASRNCLVGSGGVVKVSDFGLAKFMEEKYYHGRQNSIVPLHESAPEVKKFRLYSSRSDVWSFGMLILEIFWCGENVARKVRDDPSGSGLKFEQPKMATKDDQRLMTMCCRNDPLKRPDFSGIQKYFEMATIAG